MFSELTTKESGKKLLQLFASDLLPGVSGSILEAKNKRDFSKRKVVSKRKKIIIITLISIVTIGMLFYVFLFATNQTERNQNAWFLSFIIWLFMDIFILSTTVTLLNHVAIPSFLMKDISKIKKHLYESLYSYTASIKESNNNNNKDELNNPDTAVTFNSAKYLLLSYRLAKVFPDLRESRLISQFTTPWPKRSYQHETNVTKDYDKKFSYISRSIVMVGMFGISALINSPVTIQDLLVNLGSTLIIGYIFYWHVYLWDLFPLLAFVPLIILFIVIHFFIKANRIKKANKSNCMKCFVPLIYIHI